jgi:hypothetical protein
MCPPRTRCRYAALCARRIILERRVGPFAEKSCPVLAVAKKNSPRLRTVDGACGRKFSATCFRYVIQTYFSNAYALVHSLSHNEGGCHGTNRSGDGASTDPAHQPQATSRRRQAWARLPRGDQAILTGRSSAMAPSPLSRRRRRPPRSAVGAYCRRYICRGYIIRSPECHSVIALVFEVLAQRQHVRVARPTLEASLPVAWILVVHYGFASRARSGLVAKWPACRGQL